jgi:hypothetical protein
MAQSRDNESGACNLCPLLGHTARSLSEGAEEPDHPQTRGEELERGELAKWEGFWPERFCLS